MPNFRPGSKEAQRNFAAMVQAGMEAAKKEIRDLNEACEMTYEHTRKVVKGLAHPSKNMIKVFAHELGIPREDLERAAMQDRLRSKYGERATEVISGIPRRLEALVSINKF